MANSRARARSKKRVRSAGQARKAPRVAISPQTLSTREPSRVAKRIRTHLESLGMKPYDLGLPVSWVLLIVLRATDVVTSTGFLVFLMAIALAALGIVRSGVAVTPDRDPFRAASQWIALILFVLVPVFFDPDTGDIFNVTKYTMAVCGAAVLGAIWLIRTVWLHRAKKIDTPLRWPVLALLIWTLITGLTSTNIRVSMLGEYGTYEGFYLAAAFTVIALAVFWSFERKHIQHALTVLFCCGGGLVVLYGAMQLSDRVLHTHLDWVPWGTGFTFYGTIWSTLGNPNHLGGFCATLLPIGIVLLIQARRWSMRLLLGVVLAGSFVEILETASRGAWAGAIISVALLTVLIYRQAFRKALVAGFAAGATGVLVILAGVFVASSSYARSKIHGLFHITHASTITQRVELVKTAVLMANHSPIVGLGPDTFQIAFPRYQTSPFVALYGPVQLADGPHNVFAFYLAGEGYVGLLLWCAVLVAAALVSIRAWRRHRSAQLSATEESRSDPRWNLLLAGIVAGLVAYVIQACFDPLQIGIAFLFWVLLGLLAVLARDVGVPAHLLMSRGPVDVSDTAEQAPDRAIGNGVHSALGTRAPMRRSRRRARPSRVLATAGASIALAVALGFLGVGASAPYRADKDFYTFLADEHTAGSVTTPAAKSTAEKDALATIQAATRTNPWEPQYFAYEGQGYQDTAAAQTPGSNDEITELNQAEQAYGQALLLYPGDGPVLENAAQGLISLAAATHDTAYKKDALLILRKAIQSNPLNVTYQTALDTAEKS